MNPPSNPRHVQVLGWGLSRDYIRVVSRDVDPWLLGEDRPPPDEGPIGECEGVGEFRAYFVAPEPGVNDAIYSSLVADGFGE
jgi:hypothetical protein